MTSTSAARLRRRPSVAERTGLGAAALAARIDLLDLEPNVEFALQDFDRESVLSAPGIEVRFDTRRVQWHASPRALTLVLGRPQLDGRPCSTEQLDEALGNGTDAWRALGGRFAVVRIDLAASEAMLATDRFGVWPLTWARKGLRIAFSDRADKVPSDDGAQLDAQALFDYAYFHMIPGPRTVFRGVSRLEPATVLCLSATATRQQPLWTPAFAAQDKRAPTAADFRAAVQAAVLDEADGNTGCFLSGGTDSSTVAGMLARARGGAQTFSIGFDAAGYDEMSYARIAARHFGTDHHEYYVTPDDLVRAIPSVAAHYDQPFGNSSAVPAYYCARMAGHHGVQRLLAGDGGDELFGGNLRYAKQKIFEVYQGVPGPLRFAVLEPLLLNRAARALPGVSKAASYVAQACVPMPARMETYNLLARFGAGNVFTPRFLEQVDASAPAALQAAVYGRQAHAPFVDRMLAYDWRFTLADNDLPKVVGTTQLAGLDVGFPLLADAVVDLSLRLPAEEKVRGMKLRHFFKASLVDFLPPEILTKKKHGFGLPVGPWLVKSAPFRSLAYDALQSVADRGVVQRSLVDDLFSRRLEEHPGYYGEMVWVLMMLEHWMRWHAPSWSCR